MRGPTSSGSKSSQAVGLIPLSIKEIFDFIEQDHLCKYKVSVSYLEVSDLTATNF